VVEHFDDRPQLQQPTKRSLYFDFLEEVYLEIIRWLIASVLYHSKSAQEAWKL